MSFYKWLRFYYPYCKGVKAVAERLGLPWIRKKKPRRRGTGGGKSSEPGIPVSIERQREIAEEVRRTVIVTPTGLEGRPQYAAPVRFMSKEELDRL